MFGLNRRRFFQFGAAATAALAAPALPAAPQPVVPATIAKVHEWKWWVSFDGGELFTEDFPTREAAERYAANSGGGLIAECLQQDFDLRLDSDQILDMLLSQNEEILGDGDFIDATAPQMDELEAAVNLAISAWAGKHNIHKTAWQFASTRNAAKINESEDARERERLHSERWWRRADAVGELPPGQVKEG